MPERMPTILDEIIARTRADVAAFQTHTSLSDLKAQCGDMPASRDFVSALKAQPIGAIAEFKKASPSAGLIRDNLQPADVARQYEEGGARCLSVLTERHYFQGDIQDLQAARNAVSLPVLRKDFIVEPWQVYETRAMGADAMLLIVCCLERAQLEALHGLACSLGLSVLVEVHDDEDLRCIEGMNLELVGINNRNLHRMETNLDTSLRLRSALPSGVVTVSESGIRTRADVRLLEVARFDAILVGERLMSADDPGQQLRQLLQGEP